VILLQDKLIVVFLNQLPNQSIIPIFLLPQLVLHVQQEQQPVLQLLLHLLQLVDMSSKEQ